MTSRVRKLTPKMAEIYERNLDTLSTRFLANWGMVESLFGIEPDNVSDIDELEHNFTVRMKHYHNAFDKLSTFLSDTRTEDSLAKLNQFETLRTEQMKPIIIFKDKIAQRRHLLGQGKNRCSSVYSDVKSKSNISQKYATAEATQTRVHFIEEEARLLKVKAQLKERQSISQAASERQMAELEADLSVISVKKEAAAALAEARALDNMSNGRSVDMNICMDNMIKTTVEPKDVSSRSDIGDISKYLLKKELLFTRLSSFTDSPSSYQSWKCSFQEVIKESNMSDSEEMDMLIKYLGPESRKHASSLKNVYRKDPAKAVIFTWKRLDERYGSPEVVFRSVIEQLHKTPKLTYNHNVQWYNLLDTLSEINALKEDPLYSSTLSYFDSHVGISSIVMKLPPGVQEKWAFRATTYKAKHNVAFPPFEEFIAFIHQQAVVRNDASLMVNNELWKHQEKPTKPSNKLVSVNKAEVRNNEAEVKDKESPKLCPIHKKDHHLNECRVFKSKSHQEKREFLKNNNLCYKCCVEHHRAKDCKNSVKCGECGRQHITAMHFTPGGTDLQDAQVRNSCIQICGQRHSVGKSCAKIFPVYIHHVDNVSNVIKCYVILDEQSNRSLVKPELFSLLGINGEKKEYILNSCAGSQTISSRIAENCVLESLDGSVRYQLPSLIECVDIPNNRQEICAPEDAKFHRHGERP